MPQKAGEQDMDMEKLLNSFWILSFVHSFINFKKSCFLIKSTAPQNSFSVVSRLCLYVIVGKSVRNLKQKDMS